MNFVSSQLPLPITVGQFIDLYNNLSTSFNQVEIHLKLFAVSSFTCMCFSVDYQSHY